MHRHIISLGNKIHDALIEHAETYPVETCGFYEDLCGACAIGSALLIKEAKRLLNVTLTLKCNQGHAWTEYHGMIYDVTASQFGHERRVKALKRGRLDGEIVSLDLYRYETLNSGQSALEEINESWPSLQRPKHWDLRWINQHKAQLKYVAK